MLEVIEIALGAVELRVSGHIGKTDIERAWAVLDAAMPAEGKLRILEIVGKLEGIDPAAIWEDLKRGLPKMRRFSHVAIVSDEAWIIHATNFFAPMFPGKIRSWPGSGEAEAREWILSPS